MPTIAVPIDVCRSGVTLTPAAKAVLLALLSYGNAPTPSVAQVAEDAGVSRRNIYRALALLRKEGYLQGTDNKNLAVGASASVVETPPPTTGSGATMAQKCANLAQPDTDTQHECATMAQKCANLAQAEPNNIYIYNNKEKDKKIEKNRKYILVAGPSGCNDETPLGVGTADSGDESPDAREALLRWASHPCLAQWHYCDAWAEEYLRMREAFPSQEALLEAIDLFAAYHDIKGRNADGFGNNTMHFLRSAQSWTSDEAAAATIREHQDRFWTRRKKRGRKHGPTSAVRTGSPPARDPEPDTELIPAVEMIPAAEAEPDPEHRAACLAFLRSPKADDDYARWLFDEQHESGLRLYVRRPITITHTELAAN